MNATLMILQDNNTMEDLFEYLALKERDRQLINGLRDRLPPERSMYELIRRQLLMKLDISFMNLQGVYHQDFEVIRHLPVTFKGLAKMVCDQTKLRRQYKAEIRGLLASIKDLTARGVVE